MLGEHYYMVADLANSGKTIVIWQVCVIKAKK